MFKVTLWEIDQTVGNPDAEVRRSYVLGTFDTLPAALKRSDEETERLAEMYPQARKYVGGQQFSLHIVKSGRADQYGDVYRSVFVSVGVTHK
ncbi:hypothetical protein EniyanLRS_158 [Mycobacterium phage EniyanLRS]|uniref:Uncharacterized protein n=1 Tax=Mycobacterium phage EniyanLRS TaxID=1933770 RepID=A0A2H4GSU4_9CAUD|nr:hypothetical protein EniyanLRS_158 [Mycobacterium phage EniyanLRS]